MRVCEHLCVSLVCEQVCERWGCACALSTWRPKNARRPLSPSVGCRLPVSPGGVSLHRLCEQSSCHSPRKHGWGQSQEWLKGCCAAARLGLRNCLTVPAVILEIN